MNTQRRLRNLRTLWVTTVVVTSFSSAFAQQSYKIKDLGTNSDYEDFSMAMGLNSQGWTENMDGFVNPPEKSTGTTVGAGRAVISIYGFNIDLGTLGKSDANSWINWGGINNRGEAVGLSETADLDPNGEDVCGFGTHLICLPFFWRNGHMSALPTLGGSNGQASAINERGEIVGFAEDGAVDATCSPDKTDNRITLPALWKRGNVEPLSASSVEPLPLPSKDVDGVAYGINDQGEAVGYTGNCKEAVHAVMWKDNTAFPLKDLGVAGGNFAYAVNSRGQIAGQVGSGNTFYAAVWREGAHGPVTNLRVLLGDFAAFATGINNRGQVVGSTFNSNYYWSRGFIWQDDVMTDLNTLIPWDSNLYIISASNINERGQISGMATVQSGPHEGEIRAYLLTPTDERVSFSMAEFARKNPHTALSANACNQASPRFGPCRFQR